MFDTGSGDRLPPGFEVPAQPTPSLPDPTDIYDARDGVPMPRRITAILAVSFGSALVVIDGAIPEASQPA